MADFRTIMQKCLGLGLALKVGLAPLHFWGPSVVAQIRSPNAYLFLVWQKIAPLFLLLMTSNKLILTVLFILNAAAAAVFRMGAKSFILVIFFSGLLTSR